MIQVARCRSSHVSCTPKRGDWAWSAGIRPRCRMHRDGQPDRPGRRDRPASPPSRHLDDVLPHGRHPAAHSRWDEPRPRSSDSHPAPPGTRTMPSAGHVHDGQKIGRMTTFRFLWPARSSRTPPATGCGSGGRSSPPGSTRSGGRTRRSSGCGSPADRPRDTLLAAADLAQREKACCGFFRFAVELEVDSRRLRVEVPADAVGVLDDFFGADPSEREQADDSRGVGGDQTAAADDEAIPVPPWSPSTTTPCPTSTATSSAAAAATSPWPRT